MPRSIVRAVPKYLPYIVMTVIVAGQLFASVFHVRAFPLTDWVMFSYQPHIQTLVSRRVRWRSPEYPDWAYLEDANMRIAGLFRLASDPDERGRDYFVYRLGGNVTVDTPRALLEFVKRRRFAGRPDVTLQLTATRPVRKPSGQFAYRERVLLELAP